MPPWVIAKGSDAFDDAGKPIKSNRIIPPALPARKNAYDIRESRALEIISKLADTGAQLIGRWGPFLNSRPQDLLGPAPCPLTPDS